MGAKRKNSRRRSAKSKIYSSLKSTYYARRLRVEELEDRRMLAVLTVDTDQDVVDFNDGVTSLREAIFAANLVGGSDEIVFDFGNDGPTTILMTEGEFEITDDLTITGPGAELLTIDASGNDPTPDENNGDGTRVFNINDSDDANYLAVAIAGVTLTGGDIAGSFPGGGAILSFESLSVSSSTITGNSARAGGGISIIGVGDSSSTITTSTISDNLSRSTYTSTRGGGVFFDLKDSSSLVISSSLISGNSSSDGGGLHGIARQTSYATLDSNTIIDNVGDNGGGLLVGTTDSASLTILSSTISGNTNGSGDPYGYNASGGGILAQSGENSTITISSNTITENTSFFGGGAYLQSSNFSTLTFDSNTVSLNSASYYGGGLSAIARGPSLLTISSNAITQNDGGGINATGSENGLLRIVENLISGNSSVRGAGIFGSIGGNLGTLSIESNEISDNHASLNGGGVYIDGSGGGIATFSGNSITGNSAVEAGGGIFFEADDGSTSTIKTSTISGNTAKIGGGLFIQAGAQGVLAIDSSTISDNSATSGGGVYLVSFDDGDVQIASSTISGNVAAQDGGGLYVRQFTSNPLLVLHSTITDNTADDDSNDDGIGGGFFMYGGVPLQLNHTIVAGNRDNSGTVNEIAGIFNSNFSLVGFGGEFLGPLASNGGPTQTHALLPGSPAIDGGDANLADPPEFDQRGEPFQRIVGNVIDLGAFEAVPLIVNSTADTDDGDIYNGTTTLREAINYSNTIVGADEILFDGILRNQAITIEGSGELLIADALTIDDRRLSFGSITDLNITIRADGQSRIFNIEDPETNGGDFDVYLVSLTLADGRTTGSNASLDDDTFSGGAIRSLTSGMLTIDQSTIRDNGTAGGLATGGAIFARGPVTLIESAISENRTEGNSASGGGIFAAQGELTVIRSTINNNTTQGSFASGGGIHALGAVTLRESTVKANSTSGSSAKGGGIFANQPLTLEQSTVDGNFTTNFISDGGGIFAGDDVTLVQSTISGNSTAGNESDGGGIFAFGEVLVIQSTVTSNQALADDAVGGGIWSSGQPNDISGSIVAGNTAGGSGSDLGVGVNTLSVNYSLIGVADSLTILGDVGNLTGSADDPLDPQLGALADNGGPTPTHSPLPSSPVFDAGDPNVVFDPEQFDQRGEPFARVFGGRIDIGAYEAERFVVNSIGDDDDGLPGNGTTTLREAIELSNLAEGPGLISFDPILFGTPQTIAINSELPMITDSVTIAGPGASQLRIDAGNGDDDLPGTGDGHRVLNINDRSTRTVRNVTLSGLMLTGGDYMGRYYGGGAITNRENLTVSDVIITGNSISGRRGGGGISNIGNSLTIIDSEISGNSTIDANAEGGGISSLGTLANLTIIHSTISGNFTMGSSAVGGGVSSRGNSLTLTSSTISGNFTIGDFAAGGGVFSTSNLSVTNSTITENSTSGNSADGGGIFVSSDVVTLTSSTVSGNGAAGAGGGISFNNSGINPALTIENSIVAGNTDNNGTPNDLLPDPGGVLTINHSLIGVTDNIVQTITGNVGNQTGTAASPLNPLLGPLADNGGPTLPNGAVIQTHALLPGSPALDAGDNSVTESEDQRGQDRNDGNGVDIGAYESQITPSADFDTDGDVDGADFLAWQRGFGKQNAQRADGNSDDDTDTDASDLAAWQVSFGQPQPLVAAVSSEPDTASKGPTAVASAEFRDAGLIDAALALEWLGSDSDEETSFFAEQATIEAAFASGDELKGLSPTGSIASNIDSAIASSDNVESTTELWLADELLERVFG